MTEPSDEIIGRCRTMLRLAKKSPYEGERQTARVKAKELIDKYQITNEMLAAHRAKYDGPKRERPRPTPPRDQFMDIDEFLRNVLRREQEHQSVRHVSYTGTLSSKDLGTLRTILMDTQTIFRVAIQITNSERVKVGMFRKVFKMDFKMSGPEGNCQRAEGFLRDMSQIVC